MGYVLAPTVFTDVRPDSALAQQEVCGPVLAIVTYDTDDEAVEIANGTAYGLSGGVFSGDQDLALARARRLRTGMFDVNGGRFNPQPVCTGHPPTPRPSSGRVTKPDSDAQLLHRSTGKKPGTSTPPIPPRSNTNVEATLVHTLQAPRRTAGGHNHVTPLLLGLLSLGRVFVIEHKRR